MDKAHLRSPYAACRSSSPISAAGSFALPHRSGLLVRRPGKEDVEIRFDGPSDNRITSHFGVGTFTFSIPYLFRTPLGINLWVKGPANYIKTASNRSKASSKPTG